MSRELLIQCPDGQMKTVSLGYNRLSIGRSSAAELCWRERLLAQRYRSDAWHASGRAPREMTEEAQWTTKPGLTCTA